MLRCTKLPFLVAILIAGSTAAQTSTMFRNGVTPTTGYQGIDEVMVADGNRYPWDPNVNYSDRNLVRTAGAVARNLESRIMMKFTLPGVTGTVASASLDVRVSNSSSNNLVVAPLLKAWVESEATWNRASNAVAWQTPGADGAADRAITTATINGPFATGLATRALPIALVQAWVDTPATNHGVVIWLAAPSTDPLEIYSERIVANAPMLTVVTDVSTWSFRQGVSGYNGTTAVSIANGDDPQTINWNNSYLELNGYAAQPSPNDNRSSALIRVDLATVPPWATIVSATLELTKSGGGNNLSVPVFPLSVPFTEQATWLTHDGSVPWTTPGLGASTDFDPTVLATASFSAPGLVQVPFNSDGVATVQRWVENVGTNYGLMLRDHVTSVSVFVTEADVGLRVSYWEGALTCTATCDALAGSCAIHATRSPVDGGAFGQALPELAIEVQPSRGTVAFADGGSPGASLVASFPAGGDNTSWQWSGAPGGLDFALDAGASWDSRCVGLSLPEAPPADSDAGVPDTGSSDDDLDRMGYRVGCDCGSAGPGLGLLIVLGATIRGLSRRRAGAC